MGGVRGARATSDRHRAFDVARTGDRQALEDLVRRQWPRVHRIVSAETGSRTEADDLTQEAFARVLPRLGAFESEGSMAAYLDVVARNLVRDRHRRRRFLADEPVDDRPADAPGPEAQALSGLDGSSVRAAMDRLPADYRAVLRLRLQEGRPSEEVARHMGRTGAAVRQLQHRALVALRRELAREHFFAGDPGSALAASATAVAAPHGREPR
ncbi:MAG: RNA polymerase sigma factor [Acidimicrobiales bacterium]